MTKRNSKVNIVIVDKLFVGSEFATDVWMAKAGVSGLQKLLETEDQRRFLKKLKSWAKAGFAKYEGKKGMPIRPEGSGREVFRIGTHSSLFRLLGFYADSDKLFIVIDAFKKRGQKLSSGDTARISAVARVHREGRWEKAK